MRTLRVALVVLCLGYAMPVRGGGYDTPILYSARHMGMGGTAIGYVYDPSALFHNPAGLSGTEHVALTVDFSPIFGGIRSNPAGEGMDEVDSDPVFAPFFLAAGAWRLNDMVTVGLGVYPVASSGAAYDYVNFADVATEDRTKIAFIEAAPGIALDLPFDLKLGATYRVTYLGFTRYKAPKGGAGAAFDMEMSGLSFAGFKVGLQWQPKLLPIKAGLTYRHRTSTTVEAGEATVVNAAWEDVSMDFTLPSRLGAGLRLDLGPVGAALDVEYGFNSQNERAAIKGTQASNGEHIEVPSIFKWQDSLTVRAGLEYSLPGPLRLRGGCIFDQKTSNEHFPSAFGTPPGDTYSVTAGLGLDLKLAEVNLAYAYRFGAATITPEDLENRDPKTCATCSFEGDYSLGMHGLFIDGSLYF